MLSLVMQCDFSMCMAKLLNYPEPDNIKVLISSAINIEKKISNSSNEEVEKTSPVRDSTPNKVQILDKPPTSSLKEHSPLRKQEGAIGNTSVAPNFFSSVNNMVESLTKLNPFGSLIGDGPSKDHESANASDSSSHSHASKSSHFEEISIGVSIRMDELMPEMQNYISLISE
jgi:hypothetical protein